MAEIKMSVPMDDSLRSEIEELANEDGRSGAKYVERVLAQHVSKKTGRGVESLLLRKAAK